MDLVFGYLAGLLTLINPCVLPVLPIVLTGALQASRFGPLALAGGMAASFVVLGLLVASAGRALGVSEDDLARAGALAMVAFGVVLLVPRLQGGFALATGGMAARADAALGQGQQGLGGQVLAGVLLGAVWSPCIGPTLGGAIALASQGGSLWQAGAVMASFAAGVATLIVALGYGARGWLMANRARAMRIARMARPLMGGVFVLVGLGILAGLHHWLEGAVLDLLPDWLVDLSVSI
jgi:cytochrome c-type biogenesis protein